MTLLASDDVRPPDAACDLVFVYGTLRRGFSHHHLLKRLRARPVGRGSVRAELYDLGAFPGAKPAATDTGVCASGGVQARRNAQACAVRRVVGELYQLQNPVRDLKVLDGYEGFRPSAPGRGFFRRELTEVSLGGGTAEPAWVYWLNRTIGPGRLIVERDYALR
jgi:gamma-glutamylcyclotransferase (GGCT)/AIG2-like uncharacterized protein YtfP